MTNVLHLLANAPWGQIAIGESAMAIPIIIVLIWAYRR
jgi:hypothetical protein